jgi:hypothetical protein
MSALELVRLREQASRQQRLHDEVVRRRREEEQQRRRWRPPQTEPQRQLEVG